jgi:hypothetical protein
MSQVANPVMSGARITLAEADVTGVRLEPIRRVAVRGRVVAPPGVPIQGLSVSAIPLVSEGPAGPQGPGPVRADGAFEFHTWPGRVIVRVFDDGKTPGSRPRPRVVRFNGANVTRTGIEVERGRDFNGLVIEIGR